MKILIGHNHYQQPGGEDAAVEQETALLRAAGHKVVSYRRSNSEVHSLTSWQKLGLPLRSVWARDTYRDIKQLIRSESPDVAHFHNTHFMISPAAYYACHDLGVPVIQTIHNYRLLCPAAQFLRTGRVCEDCMGKVVPWPGVLHACYRASRTQTAMVAATLALHRWRETWSTQVDKYVVLTAFVRKKLIEGGLPAAKLIVKPNCVHPDPVCSDDASPDRNYLLFAGRLATEKGVDVLLMSWKLAAERGEPMPGLKIVGSGPLAPQVAEAARQLPGVEWLGQQSRDDVLSLMNSSLALVFPSIWYEGLPLVILEAFAVGLPVIASRLGSMVDLIDPGRTGLHFRPGDPEDLALKIAWLANNPTERVQMGRCARAEFEAKYTAQRNYNALIEIYESVRHPIRARE